MLNLKEICDDDKYPPNKIFFSRRNKVALKDIMVNGEVVPVVIKEHFTEEEAHQEVIVLTNLVSKQVKVPHCYGEYKNKVITEYLPGSLLNVLVDNSKELGYEWIAKLAQWYTDFHNATRDSTGKVLLKEDNNLRNFVYHQGYMYGLDFEAPIYGHPEQDIGECCAYILTNSPAFTKEKFFVIKELLSNYIRLNQTINFDLLKLEITKNLHMFCERRPNQKAEIISNLEKVQLFDLAR